MKLVVALALSLLLLCSCSAFKPSTQSVAITASEANAEIFIDGQSKGTGTVTAELQRNKSHAVMARVGDRVGTATIGTKMAVTGILDIVGGVFFLIPLVFFGSVVGIVEGFKLIPESAQQIEQSFADAAVQRADAAAEAMRVYSSGTFGEIVGVRAMEVLIVWSFTPIMGWNFLDQGMQVVFSRAIPGIVRRHSRDDVASFLEAHDLGFADISCWIVHPGGVRVIEAYEEALDLPEEALQETRRVLRDHGNMSSATVLFVLDRFLQGNRPGPGEHAVLTALGPGFSSEHVLLRGVQEGVGL